MAGWDPKKDEVVQKFKQKTFGLTRLQLAAHSYDGGEPRLQITRQIRKDEDSEDWKFVKLGRLDYLEAVWLGKAIRKVVKPWFEDYFDKHGTGKRKKKNKGKQRKKDRA
jgi:hypothetical protein